MSKFYTKMKKETGVVEALTDDITDVMIKFAMWWIYPTSMQGLEWIYMKEQAEWKKRRV